MIPVSEGGAAYCAVCGETMDRTLPLAGYRTHPCCDPDEAGGGQVIPMRAARHPS